MAERMEPAEVPQGLVDAAERALDAAQGQPEEMTQLTMVEAIRIIIAAVLPLHADQLGAELGKLTMRCPHHTPPRIGPGCIPCARYTALVGARRFIEGRSFSAEAVRQFRQGARDGT